MKLSKLISDLIAAQDKFDSKAFAENFYDDAIVHDEGKHIMVKQRSGNGMKETRLSWLLKFQGLFPEAQ